MEGRLFHREYWHPKKSKGQLPSRLDNYGHRMSHTVRISILYPEAREPYQDTYGRHGKGWHADASAFLDLLKKYKLHPEVTRPTHAGLVKALEGIFKKMEADGWVETECSLSLRAFVHTKQPPGKFWVIFLEGNKYQVNFGKIPTKPHASLTCSSGNCTEKAYPTPEKALLAYHKIIAKKIAEGYVELHARPTDYSTPPTASPPKVSSKGK